MNKSGVWSLWIAVLFIALSGCSSGGSGTADDGEPMGADGDAGVEADGEDGGAADDGGTLPDEDLDGGDEVTDEDVVDGGDGEDAGDTDMQPVPCFENSDCQDDQFCLKTGADCVAEGVCEPRPTACGELDLPVCGCDLTTYLNSCEAHAAGVNVFSMDACAAFQSCLYDQDCPEDRFCEKYMGCIEPGLCAVPPSSCTDDYDPVCGCDQVEYINTCHAHLAGTNVSSPGGCSIEDACVSDAECQPGYFCNIEYDCEGLGTCWEIYPAGECGPPGPMDHPVCGCDGVTYESLCLQWEAGQANWVWDEGCEGNLRSCNTQADCNPGEYCYTGIGACGTAGQCRIVPDGCAEMQIFNPVCGCDGNSYSNLCMAHQNAVNVADFGACPVTGCLNNAECADGEYCHKTEGECTARGQCQAMPTDCPPENEPVCGCDGQTWWNACTSASEGVNVATQGECGDACTHNQDCPEDHYCAWELLTCLSAGQCEPRPDMSICYQQPPEMVCGCDGRTYENPCESASQGANIAYLGGCGQKCENNEQCGELSFCAREIGLCYGPGQCQERPLSCTTEDVPVCGCNGQTIPNACYAQAAGIGIVAEGPCQGTCSSNAGCESYEYCFKTPGNCDGGGFCREIPPTCTDEDAPVCGCDGVTYSNECQASHAGVSVSQSGPCPETCNSNPDCTGLNEYCAKPMGQCDAPGECLQKPQEYQCDFEEWTPVCGCDGLSYSTECHARLNGTNLVNVGKCDLTGACMFNSECDTGTFCKKAEGCRRPGICGEIPADCPPPGADDEVCSCDLTTYPSACHAWMDSNNATYDHPCGVTDGCYSTADCAPDRYCWLVGCEGLGSCRDRYPPAECETWNVEPLCGCDGNSYDNNCYATLAGTSVLSYDGECVDYATPCSSNADCDPSGYCYKATGDCLGQGVCHMRPDHCPTEYWDPVCGCDGVTYHSYCEAHFAGVNADTLSNCQ